MNVVFLPNIYANWMCDVLGDRLISIELLVIVF